MDRRLALDLRMILVTLLLDAAWPLSAFATTPKAWDFTVFLDDTEIGSHRFVLRDSGETQELESAARFNLKLLFINLYTYEHNAREVWFEGCLQSITATTNDNGKRLTVDGRTDGGRFLVHTPRGISPLPHCLMTFAYWNPRILKAGQLLNPQTGEYVKVTVTALGKETIVARGAQRLADRFAIQTENVRIDLWYSSQREWVALESRTEDGRRLRYRLR